MNDPIISVNAEDIEKNVTEMYAIFIKFSFYFTLISGTKICINPSKSSPKMKVIKTNIIKEKNLVFSARFIRFAQLYDSDITDIRGFSIYTFLQ
jgi:hypothetical protein